MIFNSAQHLAQAIFVPFHATEDTLHLGLA
jgi:hypothetical protein